jgi:hypothetical protein
MRVALPYYRARKMVVMTVRSEGEVRDLKEAVGRS